MIEHLILQTEQAIQQLQKEIDTEIWLNETTQELMYEIKQFKETLEKIKELSEVIKQNA